MADWRDCRLGDLGIVSGGGTPSRERAEYWDGPIPWITPGELTGNRKKFVSETQDSLSELGLAVSGANLLPERSLLVTSRASIGSCALTGKPMATNQGFKSLIPHADVDPSFLFHLGQTLGREMTRRASGTTFLEISAREFEHILIRLPPLDEQQRIADILDTIDEAIQATERVIAKLRHVETALLMESIDFIHSETRLGDVCSLLQDGTHLPPPRTSEGPLLLSVQNLDSGILRRSARDTRIPEAFWQGTRRALPIEAGDVCLAVVGATLGKLGIVPPGLPPFTVQRSLTVLRGEPNQMCNGYLLAVMQHEGFQRRLWQRANQTAQPGVYLGELRTIRVPSPPLEEQQRVVSILGSAKGAVQTDEARLSKLRELRSGLAADLLSGRIRTAAE